MNGRRRHHSAVSLNGSVYVLGGATTQKTCERYDPKTNTWKYIAEMNTARSFCSAVAFEDCLYVVGGEGLNKAECYSPALNKWHDISPMAKARRVPGMAAFKGHLYVFGGDKRETVERFDPTANAWTKVRNDMLDVGD